jgi:kinesin family protein 1
MSGKTTTIEPPPEGAGSSSRATERQPMSFAFDHSYSSAVPKTDANYASQDTLYQDLGLGLLEHAFDGFNASTFAYGQTSSGKSYSMVRPGCPPPCTPR